MAKKKTTDVETTETPANSESTEKLISALVQAIQLTKPVEKKNAINRKPGSPWDNPDGNKKIKLKRKMFQHGHPMDSDLLDSEEIELLNKLKVGLYFNGWVKVYKRKDSGIDIDYPIKTTSQRMKLLGMLKGEGLKGLLRQCIEEANNPVRDTIANPDED